MKLREKIEEIMDKSESPIPLPEQEGYTSGKEWAIERLLYLFQETVKEAKPERGTSTDVVKTNLSQQHGFNQGIDQYESNLLKEMDR